MVHLTENVSLKTMNTLKLDVSTKYFVSVSSVPELIQILSNNVARKNELFVLGGGSNTVFSKNYRGLVIKIGIKGIKIIHEDENFVYLQIGAGEDWPSVVKYVVNNGWGGIENLAMVPGTAGAAPVQNIACYGHNLNETILYVDAIKVTDCSSKRFIADECQFGYRTSIFKTKLRDKYIITNICLKLSKFPILNTSYRSRYESVLDELERVAKPPYKVIDIYNAIINIRKRKLPDVERIGTVGSVFKNPLVSREMLYDIRKTCPDIHCYPENNLIYSSLNDDRVENSRMVRIPAAWLIENMGWCGKRIGDCGIWEKQPINIVNYGNATPEEYLAFVNMVKEAVYKKYSINLETEVVIV